MQSILPFPYLMLPFILATGHGRSAEQTVAAPGNQMSLFLSQPFSLFFPKDT